MATKAKPGLRERKKQQTRLAISQVATRMFIERGFDHVTIAEVAEAAEVSVNTIFNYFSTKEELFFDRGEEGVEALCRIIKERREGESALDALHRVFRQVVKGDSGPLRVQNMKPFIATIEASPALRARARLLLEQSEARLAQTLIEETGLQPDDPTARSVAAMVMGVWWMLIQDLQARVLRDEPDSKFRPALLRLGERGFELLRSGIGDYCLRKKSPPPPAK
ncbi:TetR/AcrR family transcriptional regulator [Hyalangium versicolor]|uniref:TetR/AcrR family transcriptional regulator n=1 Tax=Hyalangium versicolor TaxID=2861190 RepID=UPI001CC979ED|nr:TetR/AcrR family transcriptional regulator [Hyalangium versicolor]